MFRGIYPTRFSGFFTPACAFERSGYHFHVPYSYRLEYLADGDHRLCWISRHRHFERFADALCREWLLDLSHRGLHLGFIEKWWLVNPLAFAGIGLGYLVSHTKIPHAGHVLISTWASIFHITMALGSTIDVVTAILIAVFLFLAVWVPCCTSDIIFPLLWVKKEKAL